MNTKADLLNAAAPLTVKGFVSFGILALVSMVVGLRLANTGAAGKWKLIEAIADGVAGVSIAVAAVAFVMWLAYRLQLREVGSDLSTGASGQLADIRRRLSQGIMSGMARAVTLFGITFLVSLAPWSLLGKSFPRTQYIVEPVVAGIAVVSAVLLVIGGVSLLIAWVQVRQQSTPAIGQGKP